MKERGPLFLAPINPFTPREQDVVSGIIKGETNRQIAQKLKISPHTVRNLIYHANFDKPGIYEKTQILTGKKITNRVDFINVLLGDVVFFEE